MVSMRDIKRAAAQIAAEFQPQRIILFGSYARGSANADSDVDLLILFSEKRVSKRDLSIRNAVDFPFPVDLLVRSSHEYHRRIDLGDFFLKNIEEHGKVLYEATHARVGKESGGRFRHRTTRTASAQVTKP